MIALLKQSVIDYMNNVAAVISQLEWFTYLPAENDVMVMLKFPGNKCP